MRFPRIGLAALICVALCAAAEAQTIQLPTFHYFTVNTTVSVPVSGAGFAGGMQNGAMVRGVGGVPGLAGKVFPKSDLASGRAASGVGISATLIDNDQLDKAVRAEAAAVKAGGAEDVLVLRKADKITSALQQQDAAADRGAGLLSLAEIERQNSAEDEAQKRKMAALLAKGDAAEVAGKRGLAKIYYGMVSRQADGELKQQALQKLADLAKPRDGLAASKP